MVVAFALATAAITLTVGIVAFRAGARAVGKDELAKHMRSVGLTSESVKLLGRAAKILRRLDGLTDLDGDLAADMLSPESKKQVSAWLADYRKGLNQL